VSLVYLLTRLPKLKLGEAPAVTRVQFLPEALSALEGRDREELVRAAMLEEIEETVRAQHHAQVENPSIAPVELIDAIRIHRQPTPLGIAHGDLPEWVLEPAPQHVLLRRYWQHLAQSSSAFLKGFASFEVNLEEVITGMRCQREKLTRAEFIEQMSGRFDSASRVIVNNYEAPDLGIGNRFSWFGHVKAAMDDEDKLEGERVLDRLRFVAIDNLRGTDAFSIDSVLATYFQLRIVEREASWDADEGRKRLDQILTIPAVEAAIAG
jgi:hypothetical protein